MKGRKNRKQKLKEQKTEIPDTEYSNIQKEKLVSQISSINEESYTTRASSDNLVQQNKIITPEVSGSKLKESEVDQNEEKFADVDEKENTSNDSNNSCRKDIEAEFHNKLDALALGENSNRDQNIKEQSLLALQDIDKLLEGFSSNHDSPVISESAHTAINYTDLVDNLVVQKLDDSRNLIDLSKDIQQEEEKSFDLHKDLLLKLKLLKIDLPTLKSVGSNLATKGVEELIEPQNRAESESQLNSFACKGKNELASPELEIISDLSLNSGEKHPEANEFSQNKVEFLKSKDKLFEEANSPVLISLKSPEIWGQEKNLKTQLTKKEIPPFHDEDREKLKEENNSKVKQYSEKSLDKNFQEKGGKRVEILDSCCDMKKPSSLADEKRTQTLAHPECGEVKPLQLGTKNSDEKSNINFLSKIKVASFVSSAVIFYIFYRFKYKS